MKSKGPNIYGYSNYRIYLRDWIAHCKLTVRGFTAQRATRMSGLPDCTLSTIISGKMGLSDMNIQKLAPNLKWNRETVRYLKILRDIEEDKSQEKRLKAFRKMQNLLLKRGVNLPENEAIKYLSDWYKVAIREMSFLPNFKADPEWIQQNLIEPVPLQDIKDALQFLISSGFIDISKSAEKRKSKKRLHFKGGFYRLALAEYMSQYMEISKKSIRNVPREERAQEGYTATFTEEEFQEIKSALTKTLDDIIEKTAEKRSKQKENKEKLKSRRVYHLSLGIVPVTKRGAA